MKKEIIKFRITSLEKKMLKKKAAIVGVPLSEYLRRVAFKRELKPRLTEEQIHLYKRLAYQSNSLKLIGNMFSKKDPNLKREVWRLSDAIKDELQNFRE